MNILDGTGEIIDAWLHIDGTWAGSKTPRYKSKTSCNRLVESPPASDGCALVSDLLAKITANWQEAMRRSQRRPSVENWRFDKKPNFSKRNASMEKILEKRIAKITGDECANQIPTASGLGDPRGRHCNVDLSERKGCEFDLIELKVDWNGGTPVSAAFQALNYGAIYLFWRMHLKQLMRSVQSQPVLSATALRLRVLAPRDYYRSNLGSLKWLQDALSRGISAMCQQHMGAALVMDFRFDAFHEGFRHDFSDQELLHAWCNRGPLYHD